MSTPHDRLPESRAPARRSTLQAARGLMADRNFAQAALRWVGGGTLAASLAANAALLWHQAEMNAHMARMLADAPVTIIQFDSSGQRLPEVVRAIKGEPVDMGQLVTEAALKRWVRLTNEYSRSSIIMQYETALPLMCDQQRDGLLHYFNPEDKRSLLATYGTEGRAHVSFPSGAVNFLPSKGQVLVMFDLTVEMPGHPFHGKTRRRVAQLTYQHAKVPQGDPKRPEFGQEISPTGVCISSSREGD